MSQELNEARLRLNAKFGELNLATYSVYKDIVKFSLCTDGGTIVYRSDIPTDEIPAEVTKKMREFEEALCDWVGDHISGVILDEIYRLEKVRRMVDGISTTEYAKQLVEKFKEDM